MFEIEANKSGTFTFSDADHLYQVLEETSLARIGTAMIFDLVYVAQEELVEKVSRKNQEKGMQFQGIQQTEASVSDWRNSIVTNHYIFCFPDPENGPHSLYWVQAP